MTRCKNCGHESHCGNPLRKAVDRSQPHAAGLTEIEVCKACRCALCEDKAKVIYKRYSELCYHDQSDWDWEQCLNTVRYLMNMVYLMAEESHIMIFKK